MTRRRLTTDMPQRPGVTGGRQRLIAAGRALLAERDTDDFSVRDVAERAGLNISQVSYYFGSKDNLRLAIVLDDVGPFVETYRAIGRSSAPPSSKIADFIRTTIDAVCQTPYLHGLTIAIMRDFDERDAQRLARDSLQPIYLVARGIIEQGVAAGEFRRVDPLQTYTTIMGACINMFTSRAVFRFVFDERPNYPSRRDALAEHTIDMVLAGLKAAPPEGHGPNRAENDTP